MLNRWIPATRLPRRSTPPWRCRCAARNSTSNFGVTIGICIAAAGSDPELVLNVADEALYEEKATMRGSTRIIDLRL